MSSSAITPVDRSSGRSTAARCTTAPDAVEIIVTKYGPRAGLVRPENVAAFISEALALATTRPLVTDVAARPPLNRVADAYRALDSGAPGKVLVLPNGGNDSGFVA